MVKKLLLAAALATVSITAMPAAHAATFITFDGTSGTFGNNNIVSGDFDDTFFFNVPLDGTAGNTISSIRVSSTTNIDFTSVTLNGDPFDIDSTGTVEFRSITSPVLAGQQTIRVIGTSGGNASYAGTISYAAIPEPAVWATMLIGFGAVGTTMRRTRRQRGLATATA
jgi:hypothetical protein